jgi:hypothetical protein
MPLLAPPQVSRPLARSLVLAVLLVVASLTGCGPETAWNCDIGDWRCHHGVNQVCVLDHADTTPDGTITTYIGRWVDKGTCP